MPDDTAQPQQGTNQYRSLQEMDREMAQIRAAIDTLDRKGDHTDDDVRELNTLISRHKELEEDATPLRQRMAEIRRIARLADDPANREDGTPKTKQAPDMVVRNKRDPLEDLDRVRSGLVPPDELRARAKDVIELDNKHDELAHDFAEAATQRAQASSTIAKHILLTGTEEYRDAFRAYLQDPQWQNGPDRFRAINLTAASGGYLLPYVLDPTIVLTNNASANPFRRIARGVTTTSNAWQGVNSAGVTAAWLAEAAVSSDNSPTLGQIQIFPEKAAAWVFGSYEALDDTDFGVQLPQLLADARDRLESAAFTTGAGHGSTTPLGIAAALGTGSRVAPGSTGTAFATGGNTDVYNLQAALPPRFRNSRANGWLANLVIINKVRALDTSGGSSFWANFGSDTPEQLLGKPIYEGSDMNSVTTGTSAASGTGSMTLLFGDWDQFIIVDRVGVSMLYDPILKGTGANAQLPTGQGGWYMFWRTSSGISTTAAFRYLTIS